MDGVLNVSTGAYVVKLAAVPFTPMATGVMVVVPAATAVMTMFAAS
jgi:hypothetical protein